MTTEGTHQTLVLDHRLSKKAAHKNLLLFIEGAQLFSCLDDIIAAAETFSDPDNTLQIAIQYCRTHKEDLKQANFKDKKDSLEKPTQVFHKNLSIIIDFLKKHNIDIRVYDAPVILGKGFESFSNNQNIINDLIKQIDTLTQNSLYRYIIIGGGHGSKDGISGLNLSFADQLVTKLKEHHISGHCIGLGSCSSATHIRRFLEVATPNAVIMGVMGLANLHFINEALRNATNQTTKFFDPNSGIDLLNSCIALLTKKDMNCYTLELPKDFRLEEWLKAWWENLSSLLLSSINDSINNFNNAVAPIQEINLLGGGRIPSSFHDLISGEILKIYKNVPLDYDKNSPLDQLTRNIYDAVIDQFFPFAALTDQDVIFDDLVNELKTQHDHLGINEDLINEDYVKNTYLPRIVIPTIHQMALLHSDLNSRLEFINKVLNRTSINLSEYAEPLTINHVKKDYR